MSKIAVVAHSSELRAGLFELRRELEPNDIVDLLWSEIPKNSRVESWAVSICVPDTRSC